MSHRRWRQSVAPGVSPGLGKSKLSKPVKRATDDPWLTVSVTPSGLKRFISKQYPGLTPRGYTLPPAALAGRVDFRHSIFIVTISPLNYDDYAY